MQIIAVMALVQLQSTSYHKKNFLHYSVPEKHGEIFKIFSRTTQDLETKFKDFQGLSRTGKNP